MNPLSWPVIIGTLLIASPALWAAQVSGTLSSDVALTRMLICLAVVWAGCSVAAHLTRSTVAANKATARAIRAAVERAEQEEAAERNRATELAEQSETADV